MLAKPRAYSNIIPAILNCMAMNPLIPINPEIAVTIWALLPNQSPIADAIDTLPKNSFMHGAKKANSKKQRIPPNKVTHI